MELQDIERCTKAKFLSHLRCITDRIGQLIEDFGEGTLITNMQIQDLIDYLNNYTSKDNQLDDFFVEVNGETNSGLLIKNNTGDAVDLIDLTDRNI